MIDIKVPTVGESINEVTLVKWLKNDGEYVDRDEVIAELESEKATFEVNAEKAGKLKTVGKEGDTLNIGDTLAQIDEAAAKPEGQPVASDQPASPAGRPQASNEKQPVSGDKPQAASEKPAVDAASKAPAAADIKATPVASAIIADKKVDP